MLAHISSEVGAPVRPCVEGVNNILKSIWDLVAFGDLDDVRRAVWNNLMFFNFVFFRFQKSLLQLFCRMLQHCFSISFDDETSPDFSST